MYDLNASKYASYICQDKQVKDTQIHCQPLILFQPELLKCIDHARICIPALQKDHIIFLKDKSYFAKLLIVTRSSKTKSTAEIFQGNLAFKQ